MVFKSGFCTVLTLILVTVRPKPKKNISFKCNHNHRNGIDNLVVAPSKCNNIAN